MTTVNPMTATRATLSDRTGFRYEPQPVARRIAPAPVGSGISIRTLPIASFQKIAACADHWLAKCQGDYSHPATRWVFEMANEVKALLGPLRAEELRRMERLQYLEELLAQWNEVFGGPKSGDLASPTALAAALRDTSVANTRLRAQLDESNTLGGMYEQRCLELLRQHHAAHEAERKRDAKLHAEEIARLRDIHAAKCATRRTPHYISPITRRVLPV